MFKFHSDKLLIQLDIQCLIILHIFRAWKVINYIPMVIRNILHLCQYGTYKCPHVLHMNQNDLE